MNEESCLLAGAWRLDQDILGQIYDQISPGIFRYAWRLLGNSDAAEECVAETFSRFLKALSKGKGPRDYLKAYLYRIAHNWIQDYWRSCESEVELAEVENLPAKEEDLVEGLADQQAVVLVRTALNKLTPEQQAVIVLKYIEDWDNEEISKTLNKPVGAVKALQHRALNSLRRQLLKNSGLDLSQFTLPPSRQVQPLEETYGK